MRRQIEKKGKEKMFRGKNRKLSVRVGNKWVPYKDLKKREWPWWAHCITAGVICLLIPLVFLALVNQCTASRMTKVYGDYPWKITVETNGQIATFYARSYEWDQPHEVLTIRHYLREDGRRGDELRLSIHCGFITVEPNEWFK